MKQDLVITYIIAAGFVNTTRPPTVPLVVHGVPGCGKSTLIRKLLQTGLVQGYTAGPAYGDTLTTAGVLKLPTPFTRDPKQETLVLDEYQLADPSTLDLFDVLVGDPYQGCIRREPHFIKESSHRVPKPITDFLRAHQYQISGDKGGTITQIPLYATNSRPQPPKGKILHLGPLSRRLTHSHGICSAHPSEVQGQEFDTVTLVCHTSEIRDRVAFYVACTRALKELFIIAEAPIHELRAAT